MEFQQVESFTSHRLFKSYEVHPADFYHTEH